MGNITDILKYSPKPFREVITLIGGMGFLLLFWFFRYQWIVDTIYYHIPVLHNINLRDFRIEIDFIFIFLSYLVGRMILCTTFFILQPGKISYIFKKKEDMMDLRIADILSKSDFVERDFQLTIFAQFFLVYSIIGIFLSSGYWKIVWVILLLASIATWRIRKKRGDSWKEKAKNLLTKAGHL